jgi:hypothetical protein
MNLDPDYLDPDYLDRQHPRAFLLVMIALLATGMVVTVVFVVMAWGLIDDIQRGGPIPSCLPDCSWGPG